MPGIVGIVHKFAQPRLGPAAREMLRCLMHEPFYQSGTLNDKKLCLEAGSSCQQGSYSDCLPIWNESKDICLVFCGEHFSNHTGNGSSSAASLVGLYEEDGMDALRLPNRAFSGLKLDLREEKIVLFNDRYGLGRIYYHENGEGFYFASEAKALLTVLPQLRQLDLNSWGEFFACGCVLQDRSLFTGISLLPSGSA